MDRRGMPPNSSYSAASRVPPSPLNITAGAPTCAEPWDFRTVAYPAVYGAVFLVGLAGNAAALWVFAFRTRARSATTVYMANLAASDLLLVLALPFHGAYHALGGNWVFGEAACRVAGVLFFGSMYVSVTSLALVGVERYHAVLHPTRRRGSARRPRNARVVCALLWLVHACGAARVLAMEHTARVPPRPSLHPPLRHDSALQQQQQQQLQDRRGWRTACFESHSREVVYASLLGYAVSFLAPLAVLLYCYARIALRLRGGGPGRPSELATLGGSGGTSPARTHTRERSLRSVRLTMAVFVLCYVPFHATHVLELLVRYAGDPSQDGHCRLLTVATVAHRVALALSVTNAALDPVVYYCTASSFRRELRQMFTRCCVPRRRA
ncbi:lysophosphatidic acid receptor 6-like [Petromyzon marinus]|uniref:lysophosphatidic acid receptor 6-like n=1 Tax=Petromyzon marinus TaxID=7757 RepID=UPI003F6E6844